MLCSYSPWFTFVLFFNTYCIAQPSLWVYAELTATWPRILPFTVLSTWLSVWLYVICDIEVPVVIKNVCSKQRDMVQLRISKFFINVCESRNAKPNLGTQNEEDNVWLTVSPVLYRLQMCFSKKWQQRLWESWLLHFYPVRVKPCSIIPPWLEAKIVEELQVSGVLQTKHQLSEEALETIFSHERAISQCQSICFVWEKAHIQS